MIWEALLWAMLTAGEALEAPLAWVIPPEAMKMMRDAAADYGVAAVASLSRFFTKGALGFFTTAMFSGLAMFFTYMLLRLVRAVRSWLP